MDTLTEPREKRRIAAPTYSPSDEDKAALRLLEKRFSPDDQIRRRLEEQWELNRAFLAGMQYLGFNQASRQLTSTYAPSLRWKSRSPHNLCKAYVRQAVSTIGNFKPRFKGRPSTTDPEDLQAANVAEKVLFHYWDALKMGSKKWELLQWLKTCGNAFIYTRWDPQGGEPLNEPSTITTEDGEQVDVVDQLFEGDMVSEIVSPYHVFVDNRVETPDDLRWWMRVRATTMEWVEQHFPDKAALVPPGIRSSHSGANNNRWFLRSTGAFEEEDSKDNWKDWVLTKEYTEVPSMDYPRGRLIIEANGVVLFRGNNPHPRGKLGLVWIRDDIVPGQLWGRCDLEDMLPLQRTINRLQNKRLEHVVLTANAKLLEHATNELPESAIITEIGERVKWNGMTPPSYLPPPPLGNDTAELEASVLQYFDRVSLSYGAERGQYQGKISGKAYIQLIEQGIQSKAPVVERLTDAYSEWARDVLEWVQEYCIEQRLIKVVGRGNQFDVTEFKGADLRGNTDVAIDPDSMALKSKALALEMMNILAPGQQWLNPADSDDRTRVWRMLGMEDEQSLIDDKMRHIRGATVENGKLMLGEFFKAQPYEDQEVHVFIHNQMRLSDDYKTADPIIRAIFDAHVQSHMDIITPRAGATLPDMEETVMEGPEQAPQRGRGGPPQQQQQPQRPALQPLS